MAILEADPSFVAERIRRQAREGVHPDRDPDRVRARLAIMREFVDTYEKAIVR